MSVKTIEQIRDMVYDLPEYGFLFKNKHLGGNIKLLGLGGSYAYGMAKEGSDVDLRGIAFNSKEEILRGEDFEQVVDTETDTTVYSLKKIVNLLLNNNPNTIEILGLSPHQLVIADFKFYQELKDLEQAFLSKKCINSFGGYANSQLRSLEKLAKKADNTRSQEKHIYDSIKLAEETFRQNYKMGKDDYFKLYIDEYSGEEELLVDVNVGHYPLRPFCKMVSDYNAIVRGYDKLGKRNKHAIHKQKLSKHMAHLVRLYHMCFDILEGKGVITYRYDDHDELMEIRNGKYVDGDEMPKPEFFTLVDKLDDRLKKLSKETSIQGEPNYELVYKWLESVNERVVSGKW